MMPDMTTRIPDDVRTPTGADVPPGSGGSAGGITSWDHDNDPGTPPYTLVPAIDSLFESPDNNDVFHHRIFVPEPIQPDDVTSISVEQLNPCATATCTADETAAGKDRLPDLVITTKGDEPSYTILSDPANPGTLQPPKAIGAEEHDDRDVKISDINLDGVPDLVIVSYDAPNRVYYGDPTRPGDYELTRHDEFGLPDDGSIAVEVADLDQDPSTPPDVIVANEKKFDKIYMGSFVLSPQSDAEQMIFLPVDIPDSAAFITTDVAVGIGLGGSTIAFDGGEVRHHVIVFTNQNGPDQVLEWAPDRATGILSASDPLTTADVFVLDTSVGSANTQSVEIADVNGDNVPEIVVTHYDDTTNNVAGYVYPGIFGTPIVDDLFTANKQPIGSGAVKGVEMVLFDDNSDGHGFPDSIQIIDDNGGVHYFPHVGGNTWPGVLYPDPNLPVGSTSGALMPHDHQDANGIVATNFDADGDGFPDVISGNQLLLSSLAATKGDFSTVTPINFGHNAAPLAVVAGDFDGDSDADLFVVPGPSGGTNAPYLILNRGDGRLEYSEKAVLSSLTQMTPGSWEDVDLDNIAVYKDSTGKEKIVIGFEGPSSSAMMIIAPTAASGPGGTHTKQDWESVTNSNGVTHIANTASKSTKQIVVVDLDQNAAYELLHLYGPRPSALQLEEPGGGSGTSLDIMKSTDNGATWTIEKTLTGPEGSSSFGVGHLDNAGTNGVRRGLDIVIGGGSNIVSYYGDDMPIASCDAAPSLSKWGATTSIATVVPVGWSIEKVRVAPFSGRGYSDILFTARDASGNTKREVIYSSDASADQRNLSGIPPVDVELSDENGEQILAIVPVDANGDGAMDYVFAYENGRTKLVIAQVTARSDLASLDIVAYLASMMNPTNTPSELTCREDLNDDSCVASTDGAWVRTQCNADSYVTQWGNGHILTDPGGQTVTIGSPVSPTDASVADHGPPCALPGSDVLAVQTDFEISFPVVCAHSPPKTP